MTKTIDAIRTLVRRYMAAIARGLNRLSGGRLRPDTVTIIGFLMHIPIALLIAIPGYDLLAAGLLVVFGLFDALDGELARLQGRASAAGMLLDASTDRMKEVLLYTGIGYLLASSAHPATAAWAAAACGASLCVSYVKAKGEAAIASADTKIPHATLNRLFKDGLLTFEIRMVVLIIGLVSGYLVVAVAVITILATYTALQRLVRISKALNNV
ncbi:MAG TPA: CDP-alcohol phosphatidyltransferase family protein [Candidatus Saccharimonadales bacterium]|jgi:phosphatidylglycerophosphate synthase|nr:CDP-alcohol phosphatidyltransferase family protein [Candidatus Saccharimonadales bacterium]